MLMSSIKVTRWVQRQTAKKGAVANQANPVSTNKNGCASDAGLLLSH